MAILSSVLCYITRISHLQIPVTPNVAVSPGAKVRPVPAPRVKLPQKWATVPTLDESASHVVTPPTNPARVTASESQTAKSAELMSATSSTSRNVDDNVDDNEEKVLYNLTKWARTATSTQSEEKETPTTEPSHDQNKGCCVLSTESQSLHKTDSELSRKLSIRWFKDTQAISLLRDRVEISEICDKTTTDNNNHSSDINSQTRIYMEWFHGIITRKYVMQNR